MPTGYTTTTPGGVSGINYEYTGSGSAPASATFVLKAVPPTGASDDFTASYFAIIENTCGTIFNADPVHQMDLPAPETLSLSGNYPNPFSGTTTLTFGLPEQMDVTLSIYDVMGRKVATLVDGTKAAGTHQVNWSGQSEAGSRLASGMYLVRFTAGDQVRTGRLTIVR